MAADSRPDRQEKSPNSDWGIEKQAVSLVSSPAVGRVSGDTDPVARRELLDRLIETALSKQILHCVFARPGGQDGY
jgi:hypothetical protein